MGLLDRFRRTSAAAPTAFEPEQRVHDDVDVEEIREAVRERLLPGFLTRDEVVESVTDYLEVDGDPRVAQVVDEVWAQRLSEEAGWSGAGGHDRVAAAFAALADDGIVARMDFTCCQTCGTTEIDDERTPLADPGDGYAFREWGYTFFHQQDSERLVAEPATLFLSYSTFVPAPDLDPALLERWRAGEEQARDRVVEESDRAVGVRVAAALRAQGLEVAWDGDTGRRIEVAIPAWRKPLPR